MFLPSAEAVSHCRTGTKLFPFVLCIQSHRVLIQLNHSFFTIFSIKPNISWFRHRNQKFFQQIPQIFGCLLSLFSFANCSVNIQYSASRAYISTILSFGCRIKVIFFILLSHLLLFFAFFRLFYALMHDTGYIIRAAIKF